MVSWILLSALALFFPTVLSHISVSFLVIQSRTVPALSVGSLHGHRAGLEDCSCQTNHGREVRGIVGSLGFFVGWAVCLSSESRTKRSAASLLRTALLSRRVQLQVVHIQETILAENPKFAWIMCEGVFSRVDLRTCDVRSVVCCVSRLTGSTPGVIPCLARSFLCGNFCVV